jgi:hemoglobin
MTADLPHEISDELVSRLVETFYGRVRLDPVLGPIFESQLEGRWDEHLAALKDFWSSVTMLTGRYRGKPHAAHVPLGLTPAHFEHWLGLFETTVNDLCAGPAAALFISRAHRIAESLQIGLNIGPKALKLPA